MVFKSLREREREREGGGARVIKRKRKGKRKRENKSSGDFISKPPGLKLKIRQILKSGIVYSYHRQYYPAEF